MGEDAGLWSDQHSVANADAARIATRQGKGSGGGGNEDIAFDHEIVIAGCHGADVAMKGHLAIQSQDPVVDHPDGAIVALQRQPIAIAFEAVVGDVDALGGRADANARTTFDATEHVALNVYRFHARCGDDALAIP